jgi:hypothetical protein
MDDRALSPARAGNPTWSRHEGSIRKIEEEDMFQVSALMVLLLGADEKDVEDAIQKFKAAMKSPEASIRAEAVLEVGKTQHEKVQKVIGAYLSTDERSVRIAAKALGAFQEKKPKAVTILAEALPSNAKEPQVQIAILTALRELREKAALAVAYRYLDDKNGNVADAAIEITEAIRSRDSVEPLIKLLKRLIGAGDGFSSGDGSLDAPPDERLQERAQLLDAAAQKALAAITGESFSGAREWEAWWKKNAGSFKVKE